jgi:hypothetical protein
MCEDFAPNFGDTRTGCCITTTYHLTLPFSSGNFDTIELIEAKSQAALNTVKEHLFRTHLKMADALGTVHAS